MSVLRRQISTIKIAGFSLVEMLISILIFSIIMGIMYTYILRSKKDLFRNQEELKAANNAQTAVQVLRDDLQRIGIGRDSENDQSKLLRCGPYEIVFVGDLDRDRRDQSEKWGAWINSLGPPTGDPTFRYTPIQNLVSMGTNDWGWNPSIDYGIQTEGAEIIRFSLDYNADGRITDVDTESAIILDDDSTHNQNPADFYLIKEIWGCISDNAVPPTFRNSYSGPQIVAFNMRGNLFDTSNPTLDRTRFIYPNNNWPQPIFTYWGHFLNTVTPNDDPSASAWDGEPMDLWGDWGGAGLPSNNLTPSGEIGDGVLNQAEINRLMTDPGISFVRVIFAEDISNPTADWTVTDPNRNGIPGENRIDEIIRRIGIAVIAETGTPDKENPNIEHSNMSSSPPNMYLYKDYRMSISVNPENLAYEGAAALKVPPAPPTPPYPTSTMRPTVTPTGPTATPTQTPTFDTPTPDLTAGTPSGTPDTATPTPTPTSGAPAFQYDEIVVGMQNFILAIGLNPYHTAPTPICQDYSSHGYLAFPIPTVSSARVVAIEAANICNNPDNPDQWADVVFASDHLNVFENNLYYMPHYLPPGMGYFDPFDASGKKSIRVGAANTKIIKIASGEIDYDSDVPNSLYTEFFVVVDDVTAIDSSQIHIIGVSGNCGYFIDKGYLPYHLPNGIHVSDIKTVDLDNDKFAELVIATDSQNESFPQILIFDNLKESLFGIWQIIYTYNIFTGDSYASNIAFGQMAQLNELYPDLLVASDFGRLMIIRNRGFNLSTGLWQGMDVSPCDTHQTAISPIIDMSAFNSKFDVTPFDKLICISSSPLENYGTYKKMLNTAGCLDFDKLGSCSGMFYGTGNDTVPQIMGVYEVTRGSLMSPLVSIYAVGSAPIGRQILIGYDPCSSGGTEFCAIPVNFTVFSMTSTHNAHTSDQPPIPNNAMSKQPKKPINQPGNPKK